MLNQNDKQQRYGVATQTKELDELINGAIKKLGAKRENDICRYLPASSGGYIHHFTMRKMKHQLPEKLADMIKKFIIEAETPVAVRPKQRAARGSRKKKDSVNLSRVDLQRMLQLALSANDKELVRKLMPKRDLKSVKRELISSIQKGIVDQDLWSNYVEAVNQQHSEANAQ